MSDMKFTEDHEWILMEDEEIGIVGITDYAQDQLGEIVYVELPEVGQEVSQGADTAVVESVKAAGEVKSPVTGVVVEINESLVDEPEKVNADPTGDGWFIKVKVNDPGELESLMDEDAYKEYVDGL